MMGVLLMAATTAQAGLLTNPSFESPVLTTDTFCIFGTNCPSVPGWTGTYYLVNGNGGGAITPPAPLPDGVQFAMVQTTQNLDQLVTIPSAGNYVLTWSDAGRAVFITAAGNESYAVLFNGTTLGSFNTVSGSPWAAHSLNFSSGPGTFTLRFQGTQVGGGDNSALLDAIDINAIGGTSSPEPSTMGLAALGLAGWVWRMRRKP